MSFWRGLYGSTATLGKSRIRSAREVRVSAEIRLLADESSEKVCARHRVNTRQLQSDSRPFVNCGDYPEAEHQITAATVSVNFGKRDPFRISMNPGKPIQGVFLIK